MTARAPGVGPVDSHDAVDDVVVAAPLSPRRLAIRRFARHRVAMISLLGLLAVVVCAIVLPTFAPDPGAVDIRSLRKAPSGSHLLGTDSTGRDVFARLVSGARVSLAVAIAVAVCSTTTGLILGSVAGYFGGVADALLSRLADVMLAFPTIVVIIMIVAITGPGKASMILALGFTLWPTTYRVVRGVSLSLREHESVQGAILLGAAPMYVVARYIIPNVIGPVTVAGTVLVAQAILLESSLTFLGLGVAATTPTWGSMIREAQSLTVIESAPWVWAPPGLAICLTILAINFLGDGLRDAFDTKQVR